MSVELVLTLPHPPTVNHYWRQNRQLGRTYVSSAGKAYRRMVGHEVDALRWGSHIIRKALPLDERLRVSIVWHPPDRRRRDIDNILKALLDALGNAGAYTDDSLIDSLTIERGEVMGSAAGVVVTITPMNLPKDKKP